MKDLEIFNLYENSSEVTDEKFNDHIESTLKVNIDKQETVRDLDWISMMEETVPYIDKIFRNPNRFIVNDEEIAKIEKIKKVTVETIKHLSKHTNFIQTIDPTNGDVIPKQLLNVRKEETFNTYENRVIYTLIQNMKLLIKRRKESLQNEVISDNQKNKNDKKFEYSAKSSIKNEIVDINVNLNSKLKDDDTSKQKDINQIMERIEGLELKIKSLETSDVYKEVDKAKIALVREPIKKTNVIKKNVNFQYAMKLWDYLRDNFDDKTVVTTEQKDYEDNGILKNLMDESFLIQYLIMKTLDDNDKEKQATKKELEDVIMEQMIGKMIDMDINLTEDDLKKVVAKRFEVIKYKKLEITRQIQNIFEENIDKVREKIEG